MPGEWTDDEYEWIPHAEVEPPSSDQIIVISLTYSFALDWARDNAINPKRIIHIGGGRDAHKVRGTRGLPYIWIEHPYEDFKISDRAKIWEALESTNARRWTEH